MILKKSGKKERRWKLFQESPQMRQALEATKNYFLSTSSSVLLEVTFFLLLLTLHEISLYFTLITQNFSLSLSLSLSHFLFRKFRNWLNITRYNSCLFGMKFISYLFLIEIHELLISMQNEHRKKKLAQCFCFDIWVCSIQ